MRKFNIWFFIALLFSIIFTMSGCNSGSGDYLDAIGDSYKAGLAADFGVFEELEEDSFKNDYEYTEYTKVAENMYNFSQELLANNYDYMNTEYCDYLESQGYELYTGSKYDYEDFYDSTDIRIKGYEYVRVGYIIAIKDTSTGKLCADCYKVLLSYNDEFMDLVYSYGLSGLAEWIIKTDAETLRQYNSGYVDMNGTSFEYYGHTFIYDAGLYLEVGYYSDESFNPYYVLNGLDYLYSYYAGDVWGLTDQEYGDVIDVLRFSDSVQWNLRTYDKNLYLYGKDNKIYEVVIDGNVINTDNPLLETGEIETFMNALKGMGATESEAEEFVETTLSKVQSGSGSIGDLKYTMTLDSYTASNTGFELRVYVTE